MIPRQKKHPPQQHRTLIDYAFIIMVVCVLLVLVAMYVISS